MNLDYLKVLDQADLDDERDTRRYGNNEFDYAENIETDGEVEGW